MRPRDPEEQGRVSTSLELFFDLTFVVAVAVASGELLRFYEARNVAAGLVGYLLVFFAIWWAWVSFTWFSSAFDTSDWLYTVLTVVQMAGVLILAAGIGPAMQDLQFQVLVVGYVVIRSATIAQWLRAARVPEVRSTAVRYVLGAGGLQVAWLARLALTSSWQVASFLLLGTLELLVPVWAERQRPTPFHPEHITERYGSFTLIVLGEALLPVSDAAISAFQRSTRLTPVVVLAVGSYALLVLMWRVYFSRPRSDAVKAGGSSFLFGYLHFILFAAAAALAAGLEFTLARTADEGASAATDGLLISVPAAAFLLGVWAVALRSTLSRSASTMVLVAVGLTAISGLAPETVVIVTALFIAVTVAAHVAVSRSGGPRIADQS